MERRIYTFYHKIVPTIFTTDRKIFAITRDYIVNIQTFYDCQQQLDNFYEVSVSQMATDLFYLK